MSQISEKHILPYSAQQMYELVADVERYPDFLPWCKSCLIKKTGPDGIQTVEMRVGTQTFSDIFVSIVTKTAHEHIHVDYGGGALKHLKNDWRFKSLDSNKCEVTFFVDFEVKSKIMGLMMDMFLDTIFKRMLQAFKERAEELYS